MSASIWFRDERVIEPRRRRDRRRVTMRRERGKQSARTHPPQICCHFAAITYNKLAIANTILIVRLFRGLSLAAPSAPFVERRLR